jgi:hypothetical protein
MNCSLFCGKQRFEVLLIRHFNYLLLHRYCLQIQTLLIYSNEPKQGAHKCVSSAYLTSRHSDPKELN